MSTRQNLPMRIPGIGYTCEGGFDKDTGARPFKHASRGRNNWKRKSRKAQRREWKKID